MTTPLPRVINPDDYLDTPAGRVFTPERNEAAWEQARLDLDAALAKARPGARFYVVMGVQGAGKSTWIAANAARLGPDAIVFDAALPARRHRAALLGLAARHRVPAVGVHVLASLDEALERNRLRPADKVVPEDAVRSVFSMLESPAANEGFETCVEVVSRRPGRDDGAPFERSVP